MKDVRYVFKVLIVDDELLVRLGIKTTIAWEENNFQVVGEASNGMEAFEMYTKMQPDIVITDIKMPKMDGIELTKRIRETGRNTKIVVLTCYDEFNYLKEALVLGASDYIIKATMQPQELLNTLIKVRKEIEKEYIGLSEVENMKREIESQRPLIQQRVLFDFLKGTLNSEKDIPATLHDAGIDFLYNHFVILYFEIDDYRVKLEKLSPQEKQLQKKSVVNLIKELLGTSNNYYLTELEDQDYACILSLELSQARAAETANAIAVKIQEGIRRYTQFTLSISVSRYINALEDIPYAFVEVKEYMSHKMFLGKNCIITKKDIRISEEKDFENRFRINQEELVCYLREGDTQKVGQQIEELFARITAGKAGKNSFTMLEYTCTNLISILNRVADDFRYTGSEGSGKSYFTTQEVYKLEIVEEIKGWMIKQFSLLADHIKRSKYVSSNSAVRKALDYINANAYRPISLNDVAAHVNISRTYFSQVFKQETGENFVDYLTGVRIENAKKYLTLSDMKTYEIAEKAGFQDNSYFCRIFKEREGITPSDYRKKYTRRKI